jgi:hypothetical protein
MRRTINRALKDDRTSEEHRQSLRDDLEYLDRMEVDSQKATLNALRVRPPAG